eukprot:scaffold31018_cov63-Phaeocystis_antarctica.AAC.13
MDQGVHRGHVPTKVPFTFAQRLHGIVRPDHQHERVRVWKRLMRGHRKGGRCPRNIDVRGGPCRQLLREAMRCLPPHADIAHVGAVWEHCRQLARVAPNPQPSLIADLLPGGVDRCELIRRLDSRDLAALVPSREAVASADDA